MELFISPSYGAGDGILAEPAIEIRVTEELEKFDLSSKVVIRQDGNHAFESEVGYMTWYQMLRVSARYENTPGEFYAGLKETNTFHVAADLNLVLGSLTADASPDAFGAGARVRLGFRYDYDLPYGLKAVAHNRVRWLERFNSWDTQSFVSVYYDIDENNRIALNLTEHDFFEDAAVIKYTWKPL